MKIPDYKIVLLGFIIFLLRRYVVLSDPYVSKTGNLGTGAQIVMATCPGLSLLSVAVYCAG